MNSEENLAKLMNVTYHLKQLDVDGYSINYLQAGSGEPLLLIHGGNIGWGQYYRNIKALSEKYSIYAVDLLGAGRSSKIDYAQLNISRDLLDIVKHFIQKLDIKHYHIVGSSIGGWLALKLAAENFNDIKKVVIADAVDLQIM